MTIPFDLVDPDWTFRLCFSLSFLLICRISRKNPQLHSKRSVDENPDPAILSEGHRVYGRPDRITRRGSVIVPEIWKKSSRLDLTDLTRMGAYFIQIEEDLGIRPRYSQDKKRQDHS